MLSSSWFWTFCPLELAAALQDAISSFVGYLPSQALFASYVWQLVMLTTADNL